MRGIKKEPKILWPDKEISPIKSKTLCLTNSSENLRPESLSILFSSSTIALSRLPPVLVS